jgi:hypothetical protein
LKKGIIFALGAMAFLAGCGGSGDKTSGIPINKWKGATYRLAFDTKAAKPNPAGVTIPAIMFTANPEALEKRAVLVVRIDTSGAKQATSAMDQMVMHPVDISGAAGVLPADYMDEADKGLATLLKAYCLKDKVKITVALVRSSVNPQAAEAELDAKRLSDWSTVEVVFKNPHPKC